MVLIVSVLRILAGEGLPSVYLNGYRTLTQRQVLDEIVVGIFVVFPICLLISNLTIRCAAAGWRPAAFARSYIWTTVWITLVGEMLLRTLLLSLQCVPLYRYIEEHDSIFETSPAESYVDLGLPLPGDSPEYSIADEMPVWLWLRQMWGFACPADVDHRRIFTAETAGILITTRLVFVSLGCSIGESFFPICLTGGIATGKSTVARLLLDRHQELMSDNSTSSAEQSSATSGRKHRNRGKKSTNVNMDTQDMGLSIEDASSNKRGYDEEGSVYLIDTDSIAHEILLPPFLLAQGEGPNPSDPKRTTTYTVNPNDSVYPDILKAFAEHEILDKRKLIDRRKLGAVIFSDLEMRRKLNKLTHPKILSIMLKRLFYGVFISSQDIVCVDVPLLFEKGQLRWLFGLVVCVGCSEETQYARLRNRNPDLTPEQCRERIASQIPIGEKMKRADIVIRNDGDLQSLAADVERVRHELCARVYGIGMNLLQMLVLVGGTMSLILSHKMLSWS